MNSNLMFLGLTEDDDCEDEEDGFFFSVFGGFIVVAAIALWLSVAFAAGQQVHPAPVLNADCTFGCG